MKNPFCAFLATSATLLLTASLCSGQGITRLRDINQQDLQVIQPSTLADHMVNVNGVLYIATDDNISGSELWSVPTASFTGNTTNTGGNQNVISNVSSLTGLVVGMNISGAGIPNNTTITAFTAGTPGAGTVTISNNATATGTAVVLSATGVVSLVRDILPGPGDSLPTNLTPVNLTPGGHTLFFAAAPTATERNLWRSNGTVAGTTLVRDFNFLFPNTGGPERLISMNGSLFFEGYDNAGQRELWKSDGTTAGTVLVKDINPIPGASSGIANLTVFGTTLFFTADDGVTGTELWKSDGTTAGTVQVTDLNGGSSFPTQFTAFNGSLFFTADNGTNGEELFRVNAAANVATRVTDFAAGPGSSSPSLLTPVGNELFMVAENGITGRELYKTDGVTAGTTPVRDIRSGAQSTGITQMIAVQVGAQQRLLFDADDGVAPQNGVELWISDGTSAGTQQLKDIVTGANVSSNPTNFLKFNSTTILFTITRDDNVELWRSDGTTAGTVLVEDFLTENDGEGLTAAAAVNIRNFVLIGSTLYFMLGDDELWKSDGVAAAGGSDPGTLLVKRFRSANDNSSPAGFTRNPTSNLVYFSATDGINGRELWKTDGSEAGTTMVADIFVGNDGSEPDAFAPVGSLMLFTAQSDNNDRELWATNGTMGGTAMVRNINSSSSSNPRHLTSINGLVYFAANNGPQGEELWFSDGFLAGTNIIKDISPGLPSSSPSQFIEFDDRVFFVANHPSLGRELFATDGTEAGTDYVKDISSLGSSANPDELCVMPDKFNKEFIYFVATGSGTGQNTGRELWKSDGTEVGTVLVKNIFSSGGSGGNSNPTGLTVIDKTIYFAANDGTTGRELWKSDGTEVNTVRVRDIFTGSTGSTPNSSSPTGLVNVDGKLFFIADNGVNGAELWCSDGTSAGTLLVKDIVVGAGSPDIRELTNIGGIACFTADDGVNGRELWVSDGTANGTFLVRDLTADSATSAPENLFDFQSQVLYAAATYATGKEPRLGDLRPEIIVEHPLHTSLTAGAGTVNFGNVNFVTGTTPASASQTITIRNAGLNSLKSIAATISGTNAAEFTITTRPAAAIGPEGTTTIVVRFTPKEGGTRTARLSILSTDINESPFDVTLTGTCTKDPTVITQPVSLMLNVGAAAAFASNASSTGTLSVQWRKLTANITGATGLNYNIPAVKLTDAGAFSALFRTTTNTNTALSNTAQLGVVENLPKVAAVVLGATVTMTCNAAGNNLGFLWKKNGVNLPADARITGGNTKTLSIKTLVTGDTATYTCIVSGPGGTATGGTTHLRVFTDKPDVSDPQLMPDGIVSGTYFHQILIDPAPEKTPATYSATGLPPGLTCDSRTGIISGKPSKAGTYDKIKLTATNSRGSDIANEIIIIADFPTNVAGIYNGPVARHAVLNAGLGGRLDLTISATGVFSGSLTLGAVKHILTGALDVSTNPLTNPTGTIVIKRTGTPLPPNLTLAFTIDRANNRLLPGATVTNGTHTVGLGAWRQIWNATTTQATPYLGYYTFGLRLPTGGALIGDDGIPQGWGYGSFTVGKDGKLTLAGKTADGEGITGAAVLGPQGEILVHLVLYTTTVKGSLLGVIEIDVGDTTPANLADTTDNTVDGDLDQTRPPNPAATHRLYKPGFGIVGAPGGGVPVVLEAVGARYLPPVAPALIFGLVGPGVDNAELEFQFGGIANTNDNPNVTFDVGALNKLTLPTALAENPAATKLTVTPATGVMSGSFTLDDPNPRTVPPVTPATVKRSVTFTGMIFKDGANAIGGGYYHLDELPGNGPPPTTPTTTRKLSGKVTAKQP